MAKRQAMTGGDARQMTSIMEKMLLSINDVCHLLSMSDTKVRQLVRDKEIQSVYINANTNAGRIFRLIPRIAVEQYVARLCREQGVEVDA